MPELSLNKLIADATRSFYRWPCGCKLTRITKDYCLRAGSFVYYREKVKNPFKQNGKPYAESTQLNHQRGLSSAKKDCQLYKFLIKLFIWDGIIEHGTEKLKAKLDEFFADIKVQTAGEYYSFEHLVSELHVLKRKLPGYTKREKQGIKALQGTDPEIVRQLCAAIKNVQDLAYKLTNGTCKEAPKGDFDESPMDHLFWMVGSGIRTTDYWMNAYEELKIELALAQGLSDMKKKKPAPRGDASIFKILPGGRGHKKFKHMPEPTFTN